MKSQHRSIVFVVVVLAGLAITNNAKAQKTKSPVPAPDGWNAETIKLPPGFAKDMKLIGIEHVRFAPGMFKAKSDSFFSYVFAFELKKGTTIDQKVLQRELLKYYRGLSKVVLQDKAKDVDFSTFTLKLTTAKPKAGPVPQPTTIVGKLNWVEPFTTKAKQILHLEAQTWQHKDQEIVFVCVSPQDPAATKPSNKLPKIWEQMTQIRAAYAKQHPATAAASRTDSPKTK